MGLTRKQNEVYQYIQSYYKKSGHAPTQKEIKEYFNFKSFGSVQRYIKYLEGEGLLENSWNERRGLKLKEAAEREINTTQLPLLGNIAAGNPILALENPNDYIDVPNYLIDTRNEFFALNVQGSSMINDGMLDGDIIICKKQADANQGDRVVAIVNDEATVKFFKQKSNKIELHPANDHMSPIIVGQDDHFKIAGIVVGLMRHYA